MLCPSRSNFEGLQLFINEVELINHGSPIMIYEGKRVTLKFNQSDNSTVNFRKFNKVANVKFIYFTIVQGFHFIISFYD